MLNQKSPSKIKISVIIPFYNEGENLPPLHAELVLELNKLKLKSEIIYVNDGSTDSSIYLLTKNILSHGIPVKVISLSRRFGQTAAIIAGIDYATGTFISFLDADLQNDPHDISRLIVELQKGYDVVFGWRRKRQDDWYRSIASRIANIIIRYLFHVPLHDVGCSIKIYRKEILSKLRFYGETHRIMSVLTIWSGAYFSEIPVNHRPRKWGVSKYGYSRIIKIVIDLLTAKFLNAYNTKPAYVFGVMGFSSFFFSTLLLLYVLIQKLIEGIYVHRNPLFTIAIFLLIVGFQFFCFGLIAELQIRTYFESQNKKIYDVKKIIIL